MQSVRLDLLELFGSGYVIDCCVSAFRQKREHQQELEIQKLYVYYMSDCLRVITENTAKSAHSDASYIKNRLKELMEPEPIELKTGDEIAADIIKRAGLKFGTEGGE